VTAIALCLPMMQAVVYANTNSRCTGYVLSRRLDARKYCAIVVSPRTYFVFTPLLNDTATGTLEFRNTLEPVRNKKFKGEYLQGWADDVSFARKTVTVEPSVLDPDVGHALTGERHGNRTLASSTGAQKVPTFEISYDKLVICVGCYSQTFGTKGVRENALFLKDIGDARKIRRRVLEIFDLAILPTTTEKVKKNLLHFAVVGGGPTGMEFAANLSDLIRQDLSKLYPSLMEYVQISLYDVAPKVLPMFDAALADYAVRTYKREGIKIKTSHHVEELRKGFPNDAETAQNQDKQLKGGCYTLRTREEGDVGIGMCVWSTGLMMNPFIQKALNSVHIYPSASARVIKGESQDAEKSKWIIHRNPKPGAMIVDDHLRVTLKDGEKEAIMTDVFALGDNATLASGPLPATAQTANQQAHWLAKRLNKGDIEKETFGFKNLGMMTYLGGSKAMLQGGSKDRKGKSHGLKGWLAYLLWRGAYATMTLSWRNRMLVPTQWMVVKIFGRDVSRF
jgi:NADH dehydrogenase FAD-containing subunit